MLGSGITYLAGITTHWIKSTNAPVQHQFKYPLKVSLYRFELNKDKMKIYEDWVKWHDTEHEPIVASLEREKMYLESVFRDTLNYPNVIYWLAFNGEGGKNYESSPLAVDKKHSEYMRQILVKGSRVTLKTEFILMPPFLDKSIRDHQSENK